MDDEANGQAQKAVDLAHPLAVTLGQIVVDGDDMDTVAGQRVQIGGQGGHQGLSLTGFHLGNAALVQNDAADQLHPVGAQTQHTVRRLPDGGKGLGQDVVQRLTGGQTGLELGCFGLKLGVGHVVVLLRHGLDLVGDGVDGLELTLAVGAKDLGKDSHVSLRPFCW